MDGCAAAGEQKADFGGTWEFASEPGSGAVRVGLARIVALHHCSSASYRIR
jgi:hypothetical protein